MDLETTNNDDQDYYDRFTDDQRRFFMMFGEVSCKFANLEFVTRLILENLATPRCITITAVLTNDCSISDRLKLIKKLADFRYVDAVDQAFRYRFERFTRDMRAVIEERNEYIHCNWNVGPAAAENLSNGLVERSNYREQWKKKAITTLQKGESIPDPSSVDVVSFSTIIDLSQKLEALIIEADMLVATVRKNPGLHVDDPSIPFTHQTTSEDSTTYPTRLVYRPTD